MEPTGDRTSKQIVSCGGRRCKLWMCCLMVIATATTVLFFTGRSFMELEFLKANSLQVSSTFDFESTLNFNESQRNETYKIICMILTTPSNWETKGRAVKNTWARRCHKAFYFYTKIEGCTTQPICTEPDAIGLNVPDGRDHLTAKTVGALNYSYTKYGAEADYFLKADDDTYVITENLQRILLRFRSISHLYLGRLFTDILPKGYNSGGAGYVISKLAVKLLVENRTLHPSECQADGGFEDVEIGRCLAKFGIYPQDEMDSTKKQIFHSENPFNILHVDKTGPGSYSYVNINGVEFGNKNAKRSHMLGSWTATIHYASPPEMYIYEFLLYQLKRGNIDKRTDE